MKPIFWILLGLAPCVGGVLYARPWESACQRLDRICSDSSDLGTALKCAAVQTGAVMAEFVVETNRIVNGGSPSRPGKRTEEKCRNFLDAIGER